MGEQTTFDREQVAETFAALRSDIRAEQRRTTAERRAFEAFADRVEEVNCGTTRSTMHPSDGGEGRNGATLVTSSQPNTRDTGPTEAIRRAYEETVMAVSFYDEEYGDDYRESLRAEFGPEVATAVTDPDCFGPTAKAALLAAVERATTERTHLVETCARERESVDAAAAAVLPVAAELDSIAAASLGGNPFGTLEARWRRVSKLLEECEAAAASRQSAIQERRSQYDLPVEAPDICAYLYETHDSAHPVLSVCASLTQRATTLQTRYERAMANY